MRELSARAVRAARKVLKMDRLKHKTVSGQKRASRVRTVIRLTSTRPKLSIKVSNKHVFAQIVDPSGRTVASANTVGQDVDGTLTEKASWVGTQIGQAAKKAKIVQVVFDRGPKKYHGRIKALAEAARKEGMEF